MFSTGANFSKLKTNLKLAIQRLKLLEKKKTELALKSRKEIADYLSNGKVERAKIRVEHIIREDYVVEAMETIEMFCDVLLARFGLIQQMKILDPGIAEAVSSIIWAAPRLQTDIPELKVISEQLTVKYGKPYTRACLEGSINSVNRNLIHRLGVQAPPSQLVENYLIEIAKSHDIFYEPTIEVNPFVNPSENFGPAEMLINLNNEDDKKPPNGGLGFHGGGGGGNADSTNNSRIFPVPPQVQPRPFDYPNMMPKIDNTPSLPPPPYSSFDLGNFPALHNPAENPNYNKVESYNVVPKPPRYAPGNCPPKIPSKGPEDTLPELPDVPNSNLTDFDEHDSLDFDDLSRRFDALKKKK